MANHIYSPFQLSLQQADWVGRLTPRLPGGELSREGSFSQLITPSETNRQSGQKFWSSPLA